MRLIALPVLLALTLPGLAQARCTEFKKLSRAPFETLLAALDSAQEDCRGEAAKVLGDGIGDKRFTTEQARASLPALQDLMIGDDAYGVRLDGLRAIEEYMNNANLKGPALDIIQASFEQDEQDEPFFIKALAILRKVEVGRAEAGIVVHLSRYRRHQPEFVQRLLDAAQELSRRETRDLALVIALDASRPRSVRLAALDNLEKLGHPGLVDAYLSLLGDDDKKVQLRCIDGLSAAGLPPAKVQAALSGVVRSESKGDVRARALKGLKRTLSPELLPLLHDEVRSETHVGAWYHALEMLLSVADASSFPVLTQLLARDWAFRDDLVVEVFHVLARIAIEAPDGQFGPMADQAVLAIQTRIDKGEDSVGAVGAEARRAGGEVIASLAPRNLVQVVEVVHTWRPPAYDEVVVIDLGAVDETAFHYEMSVQVNGAGEIVGPDGAAFGFGASARVGR
jgi:hypothetical protein